MRTITNLFILAAAITGLAGCGSDNAGSTDNASKGGVAMALTNADGSTVAGTFRFTNVSAGTSYDVTTNASEDTFEVVVPPGTVYSVSVVGDLTCVPGSIPAGGTYVGCVMDPVPNFPVTEGVTTLVSISVRFDFTGTQDEHQLFAAGGIRVSQGPQRTQELCGNEPACPVNQVCAAVTLSNGPVTGCYIPCTTSNDAELNRGSCVNDLNLCMPVLGTSGGHAADAGAPVVPAGTKTALNSVLHVCVPAASTSPSTGGAPGTGGAPSTGGSSETGGSS